MVGGGLPPRRCDNFRPVVMVAAFAFPPALVEPSTYTFFVSATPSRKSFRASASVLASA